MDTGRLLDRLADRYRGQGYAVTVNPGPGALPPFAKNFKVELLAERPDGNVLVTAKTDQTDFASDTNLIEYADIVGKHRGWRYDLTLLKLPPAAPRSQNVQDLTGSQIKKLFDEAAHLHDSGFESQAVLAAWAAFESAMRSRLRAMGQKAGFGSSPKSLLNELISSGEVDHGQFRDLEGLLAQRNVIAHGFLPPTIGRGAIELLTEIGLRLLEEAKEWA